MPRIRVLLASFVILMPHRGLLLAQHPALDTPQAVVRAAFSAYESKHWSDFAALVDPGALAEFRKQQLTMAEGWEQFPRMAAVRDSTMPAAVAEYFDKMHDDMAARFGNPLLREFARVKSLDELKALSLQEFLARYLEANSPKPDSTDPHYQPPVTKREIIGEVKETSDLIHVVYRVRTDVGRYGRTEEIGVIPVRRDTTGWRIMLNDDLSFTGSLRTFGTDSLGEVR